MLRSKTDHDLEILVLKELDRGLMTVTLAATKAHHLYAEAQKSYETAMALVPWIWSDGRQRIQDQGVRLRSRLDRVPGIPPTLKYPASFPS